MELQTIYTQVLQHLARQGEPAICTDEASAHYGECAYRGTGGARCAVGYLIPDWAYSSVLEGTGVTDMNGDETDVLVCLVEVHGDSILKASNLLRELQSLHDGPLRAATTGADWADKCPKFVLKRELSHLERRYNLIRPKVFNEVFGL